MENKVISTEYVKKNFIKKSDLKEYLDHEFVMIKKCRNKLEWKKYLDGVESAYKAIQNIFLGDYNE